MKKKKLFSKSCEKKLLNKSCKQAEAEVVPSSSLVEVEVEVRVEDLSCYLYFHGWMGGLKIGE